VVRRNLRGRALEAALDRRFNAGEQLVRGRLGDAVADRLIGALLGRTKRLRIRTFKLETAAACTLLTADQQRSRKVVPPSIPSLPARRPT